MNRILKRMTLTVVLLLTAGLVLGLILAQPLLPSGAYTVAATLEGRPIKAELLRPVCLPGLYFVHLPEAQPNRYRWFRVAVSKKSVFSSGPYSGWWGIPYIHTDQAHGGLNLSNGKMEDNWKVAFTSGRVQFSNASLTVTLTP